MTAISRADARLRNWLAIEYQDYAYSYLGISGNTLLHSALKQEGKDMLLLPSFICPTVPAMAVAAGLSVMHIDVETTTLHMKLECILKALERIDASKAAILVDHAFGYPCSIIPFLRQQHPQLFIIEDCVRALGAQSGSRLVGHEGDCVLFSMYKNTPGSDHGAILLSRRPYRIPDGYQPPNSWMQWASTLRPLRNAYDALKCWKPTSLSNNVEMDMPAWDHAIGSPNSLTKHMFMRQVETLNIVQEQRESAGAQIRRAWEALGSFSFIECKQPCRTSAFFLSCIVLPQISRNDLVVTMHRKGHFFAYAWHVIPAHYRGLQGTFPYGAEGSRFLAEHVLHIPLSRYLTSYRIQHLNELIKRYLDQRL